VTFALQASNVTDLDAKIVRLNQIRPAALLSEDGAISPPRLDIRNDAGEASIEMRRMSGAPAINGSGAVMEFSFTAVGKGRPR
jgi:hypothetical protein